MTYMPQDFRGRIIRQQRDRSERNKQAAVDALINSGGSVHDKYVLLWKQQMERRRQLAELGSATGVYKTIMKYLVGVPEVLMDFVRQINDDQGPMEEQRQRYGPPLYSLTRMVHNIRLFVSLLWGHLGVRKLQDHQVSILEKATDVYTSELERFINLISTTDSISSEGHNLFKSPDPGWEYVFWPDLNNKYMNIYVLILTCQLVSPQSQVCLNPTYRLDNHGVIFFLFLCYSSFI